MPLQDLKRKKNIPNETEISQIEGYRDSGCLNYLYLVVPDNIARENRATLEKLLSRLPGVGLYTVNPFRVVEDSVTLVKSATYTRLKYDSFFDGRFKLIGRETVVERFNLHPYFANKEDENRDHVEMRSGEEKERRRKELESKVYPNEEEAVEAIHEIYAMFPRDGYGFISYRRIPKDNEWIILSV